MAPTPGPWISRSLSTTEKSDISADVQGAFGSFVADCGSHEHADANARLIAAAPDMYLELQELAGLSDEAINEGDPALLATYRDMARLLVAKVGLS